MTIWTPRLDGRSGPTYQRIADALADDVAAGMLEDGARLPTHRDLAHRLRVTVGTVSRAYAEAAQRGLIGGEVGRGTFVRRPGAPLPSDGECAPDDLAADARPGGLRWWAAAYAARDGGLGPATDVLDLSLNYPFPAPVGAALASGLDGMRNADLLGEIGGYQPANGHVGHRAAGAAWLRTLGLDEDPEQVLVVPGCQGGLTVAFLALCRPGDVVVHEALSWPGLRATATSLGLRTVGVAMDADGLLPEALDAACRAHRPRALYVMPTLHNPTAALMPDERRRAVAEVVRRHGIVVVEDDVYGFLREPPPLPLRTLLPESGIYVTSLSKAVAPGLRIGWLAAPAALVPPLAAAIRQSMLMTSSVAAEIAARVVATGAAALAAEAQRQEATIRQRLAAERLAGLDFRSHPSAFHGWLRVPAPWRRDDFVAALRTRGVIVTPGSAFAAGSAGDPGSGEAETHVRVCLCTILERERLAAALDIVRETAAGGSPSRLPEV